MVFHVSTLLYCFDSEDRVLLMHRAQEPNLGQWSPCGGKVRLDEGESPYAGAQREAFEELALRLNPTDLHLTGLVTERGYGGQPHWLMFLFEVRPRIDHLPQPHREGRFQFHPQDELPRLPQPRSDIEHIWPLFWAHRGGFFAARCACGPDNSQEWNLEASRPKLPY